MFQLWKASVKWLIVGEVFEIDLVVERGYGGFVCYSLGMPSAKVYRF